MMTDQNDPYLDELFGAAIFPSYGLPNHECGNALYFIAFGFLVGFALTAVIFWGAK